jgi:hypothetical protein
VPLRLVQGPIARDVARVLAGITVTEHDLLQVAAPRERRAVKGVREQAAQHDGGPLQVFYALEERRDPEVVRRAPAPFVYLQESDPACEELYAEDVARLVGHA